MNSFNESLTAVFFQNNTYNAPLLNYKKGQKLYMKILNPTSKKGNDLLQYISIPFYPKVQALV